MATANERAAQVKVYHRHSLAEVAEMTKEILY